MIKGRGLLAQALYKIDRDDFAFYVNGISNSVMADIPENNFEVLELTEMAKDIGDKLLIYFSTIQVNATENYSRPYVQHKIKMERLISNSFSNYIIIRTSNLVGNNSWNTNTLFNFLYHSLQAQSEISVIESAIRNVLDVDHFIQLLDYYLEHFTEKNTTRNIVNPVSFNMAEIVREFENVFSLKFKKTNSPVSIAYFEAPCEFSLSLMQSCNISLDNYLHNVIAKYYPPILKSESNN